MRMRATKNKFDGATSVAEAELHPREPAKFEPTGTFDDPRYAALALANASKMQAASPFPHIVFDNFLDPDFALALSRAFPSRDEDINWVNCEHQNANKKYQHDETKLSLLIRKMLREFNSRQFLLFLETLTGIESLIPDPYFIGGGAHVSSAGGFLEVHADFNWLDKLMLHRRLNALFYLNEDWDESWGGSLELWNKEMSQAVRTIAPVMNRLIIFATNDDSNHGHPSPLKAPPHVTRKTLNLYYYTSKRDEVEINEPHFTLYKQKSPFTVQMTEEYRKAGTKAK